MKTTQKILGILWTVISGYFCISLFQGTARMVTDEHYPLFNLCLMVFFVLLYLAGVVGGVCLLVGAGWPRIVVSIVALLTVTASVMGFFAWFNSLPFSFVGIAFDIFALASAGVLLFSRKYAMA